jgi:uncharacterized protein
MNPTEIIKNIEKIAKNYFVHSSGCHDWTHIERVRKLAARIGEIEGADPFIIEAAALLHDIGRYIEMENSGKFCHAEFGAAEAKKILEKYDLEKKISENIIHCIISHRYRNEYIPETIEAKVIYDADKLDTIGAVGIARNFIFAGYIGAKVTGKKLYTGKEKEMAASGNDHSYTKDDSAFLEYEIKLKFIKDRMLTDEGRRMAQERHDFMEKYFDIFWEEVSGSR